MNRDLATLPITQIATRDKALYELDQVYAVRAWRMAQEQAEAKRRCAEMDELLALLRDDLMRVGEQRNLWKARWQHWLEGDGMLQHGRSFTQQHAELGELENLLWQHQEEIQEQRDAAQARVDAAHAEQAKIALQRDALAQKRKQLQRALAAQRESRHDEAAGEQSLARWHGARIEGFGNGARR